MFLVEISHATIKIVKVNRSVDIQTPVVLAGPVRVENTRGAVVDG